MSCVVLFRVEYAFPLSHSHSSLHSNSQWDRKLVTAVLTAGVAIHSTLYTDYEMPPHLKGEKHVFTDLQVWYRNWIDQHVWGLPPLPPSTAIQQQKQQTNTIQQQNDNDRRNNNQ